MKTNIKSNNDVLSEKFNSLLDADEAHIQILKILKKHKNVVGERKKIFDSYYKEIQKYRNELIEDYNKTKRETIIQTVSKSGFSITPLALEYLADTKNLEEISKIIEKIPKEQIFIGIKDIFGIEFDGERTRYETKITDLKDELQLLNSKMMKKIEQEEREIREGILK